MGDMRLTLCADGIMLDASRQRLTTAGWQGFMTGVGSRGAMKGSLLTRDEAVVT